MSIRPRQRLPHFGASAVVLPEVSYNEATGNCEVRYVNQSDFMLPDVETTDLRLLLKAGVNVEKVSTIILPQKDFVTSLEKSTENDSDSKTTKEGEKVNA